MIDSDILISDCKVRIGNLDSYLNSKEISKLSGLISDIEAGDEAKLELKSFLTLVPVGRYDGNRRKYRNLTNKVE